MGDAWNKFLDALRGNRDLLALVGIGLILVIALAQKVPLLDTIAVGFLLGILWMLFRLLIAKVHQKEQLRELNKDAKVEAVKALARHVPKGDVKATIEALMKDVEK